MNSRLLGLFEEHEPPKNSFLATVTKGGYMTAEIHLDKNSPPLKVDEGRRIINLLI